MERLREEIITYFITDDDAFRFELVAMIGRCVEEFMGFPHRNYTVEPKTEVIKAPSRMKNSKYKRRRCLY